MSKWPWRVGVCALGLAPLAGCASLLGDFASGEGGATEGGATAESGGDSGLTPEGAAGDGTGPDTSARSNDGSTPSDGGGGDSSSGCNPGQIICPAGCVSSSDIRTCGACSNDCTLLPHVAAAGLACGAGVCSFTCLPGYAHCSTNPSDGCETDLSAPAHCGACGTACSGATPVCGPSGGTFACASGCPAMTTLCSGSCSNLVSDSNHCGTCSNACPGGTTCQSSTCACAAPQTNCGGTCYSTQGDPNHCGASCTQCPPPPHGTATCNSGTCGTICNPGYSACGGSTSCAYDTNSDPAHCGASCTACAAPTPVCFNGGCVGCAPGSVQCSGNTIQLCSSTGTWQTQTTCATGMTCSGNSCVCGPAPYMSCAGSCTNTRTDINNCGTCGNACTGGDSCLNGICTCPNVKCGTHSCGCGGLCCGTLCC